MTCNFDCCAGVGGTAHAEDVQHRHAFTDSPQTAGESKGIGDRIASCLSKKQRFRTCISCGSGV